MKTSILMGFIGKKEEIILSGDHGTVNEKYKELQHANGGKYDEIKLYKNVSKSQKFKESKNLEICENRVLGCKNSLEKAELSLDAAKKSFDSIKDEMAKLKKASDSAKKVAKSKTSSDQEKREAIQVINRYDRAEKGEELAIRMAKSKVSSVEELIKTRKESLKVSEGYLGDLPKEDKKKK